MKKSYKQKRDQGFTIIEVLIVLAIAALILLIVFLAVPALQRNSRNTSRRADVSNMLASINEFVSNNNGAQPTTATWAAPAMVWGAGTTSETKLNFYTKSTGTGSGQVNYVAAYAPEDWSGTIDASYDRVVIVAGGQCDATGKKIGAGGARAVAALYTIENGANSFAPQCVSS
jgi:prepilin-type N-terminal cleavage/methylation domain-containing protein